MTTDKQLPGSGRRLPAAKPADAVDAIDTVLDEGPATDSYVPISLLGIELLDLRSRLLVQDLSLPERSSALPGADKGETRRPGEREGTRSFPAGPGQPRGRGRDSPPSARSREKAIGSEPDMNVMQMHQLGKRLIQLATGARGETSLLLGDAAVLEEVLENPGISIKAIHEQTGLSQSHVSVSVARLRERGLLETVPDGGSAWRSKSRAQPSDYALQTISRSQSRSADEAVAHAVHDPVQARRAIRLMAELADILV